MLETYHFQIDIEGVGKRIDHFLHEMLSQYSRSYIQSLIKQGDIHVNTHTIKSNYVLRVGDIIEVTIPEMTMPSILPQNIPLDIVYEDEDVILVNKPKGMVVHPAAGHFSNTLVNALMYHCHNLSGINGVLRPGIVHRIDMDTTGLIIVCKNDFAHKSIAKQLASHSITRRYEAIVYHNIKEECGTIHLPIARAKNDRKKMAIDRENGKEAITHFRVLERFGEFTHIECRLETGRTHQIRVHMAHIQHPLLGDEVYGSKSKKFHLEGQCLHARVLGFIHPRTGEYMEFSSALPSYFQKLLRDFR